MDILHKIIYIPQALTIQNIAGVIAKLNTFKNSDENNIVISFSHTLHATPSALTSLLCYLRELPKHKTGFQGIIVHSNNKETDTLIAKMGFYNLLGISDNFDLNKEQTKISKDLYCFNSNTPEEEVINLNEKIIYNFTKQSKNDNYKKAISWCIPELVDNARTHSKARECVLFAQKHPRGHFTEFCIADCGIGIQKTMGDDDIVSALTRCIKQEKGIHSKGMGNGLYFTSELIKNDKSKAKSYLNIYSGDAMLQVNSGQLPQIIQQDAYWQGTIVTLVVSDEIESSIEHIKGAEVELTEDLPNFYFEET